MIRLSFVVVFGVFFTIANVDISVAAPQVLAAVPVDEPYILKCHDGVCDAEFSAICLQPKRKAPTSETAYQVFADDSSAVRLTGITKQGLSVDLPSELLTVSSVRSQTTIRFTLDRSILKTRQLRSVSLGLDRMVTLLPVPTKDDANPQTSADIHHAVAGVRRIGKKWGDANVDNMMIARITDRIGNMLSAHPSGATDDIDQLVRTAVMAEPEMSAEAIDSARRLVAVCQRRSRFSKMRGCLEEFHDQIMLGLNGKYWSALIPGS